MSEDIKERGITIIAEPDPQRAQLESPSPFTR
jgi:hypothetical protein